MSTLTLDITDGEIAAAFEPFVAERFAADDPAWVALVRENARQLQRQRRRRRLVGWLSAPRRTQKSVAISYSRHWLEQSLELQVARAGPTVPCVWRSVGMSARAVATKRVHLLFLMRTIARLRPTSVLEVGCGNGLNLFILASRFPDVRFTGIELTAGGVTAVATVRALPEIPAAVRAFAPEPLIDPKPFDRIAVVQANAATLPFPDATFEMVVTALALEQMEPIRARALAEIRRVARAYTAMVEPFADWNATGLQRDYIVANDYFTGSVADLEQAGLAPLYASADMPSKLTMRPAFVVCCVR